MLTTRLEKTGKRACDMPLAMLKRGDKAQIMTIKGTDVVKKHLGALGFVPGVMVTVVQLSYGNMILGIHDSRIAVNDDLAKRILVQAA